MRRILTILCAVVALTGCSVLTGGSLDSNALSSAAGKGLTALSISNAQIVELSRQSVAHMDQQNKVDTGEYHKRLARLLSGINEIEGIPLNFKVYQTKEINAFACGDGSIRVYTGLMDVMDDAELMAIIGHEMGHVVHHDTRTAMKRAYLASAARDVVASAGGVVGALSQTAIGDLAESYVGAQFSQKQEFAADEYGYKFSTALGYSPYSMAKSLEKLVKLSNGAQASAVAKMFSSHPDSALRAAKVRAKADADVAAAKK